MPEQFQQVADAHTEWFSSNIARCEAERDKVHGHERDLWSRVLETYRHLQVCRLRHSAGNDSIPLCIADGDSDV